MGYLTWESPALRGFIAQRPCGLPGWGLGINICVDQPTNHALVLSVMLGRLGLEELDALPAQSKSHFHSFFTKRQFRRGGEEVGNHLNLSKGFIGVFDFSSGVTSACAGISLP
jgi:hypothetical protein